MCSEPLRFLLQEVRKVRDRAGNNMELTNEDLAHDRLDLIMAALNHSLRL